MSSTLSGAGQHRSALLLVLLMVISTCMYPAPSMMEDDLLSPLEQRSFTTESMVSYDLFIAEQNSSAGGLGFITTHIPDSGSQSDETAVGGLEFKSAAMISNLTVKGDANDGAEIPLFVYIRFTGQEQSTASLKFELFSGSSVVASTTASLDDPCQDGGIFGSSCAYQYRPYSMDVSSTLPGGDKGFIVQSGKQMVLRITAETNCQGGSVPGQDNDDCDVRVAYHNVDNSNNAYTRMEVKANALANSKVKVHRTGGSWNDAEVVQWAPNHRVEFRTMQFSVDVRDAFGRDDIQSVKLVMQTPDDTAVVFEKTFDDDELRLDNEGLVGQYEWTYNSGRSPGDYGLRLEVRDMQDNVMIFVHDGIEFVEYAVFLQLAATQGDVILIAPEKTTSVEFELEHIGADGLDMEVQLSLQRNPGSDWLIEFSEPGGYELSGGGDLVRPTLTVTSPDDLSDAPSSLEIIGRAYADTDGDGTTEEVQVVTTSVDIEEVGVFARPKVSAFTDEDRIMEIADSERPDSYDSDVSHFIDADGAGRFYLEVFNTGFDFDTFRIRVDGPHTWTVRMYDQETTTSLTEDGAYFLSSQVESHNVQTLILELTPPLDRGQDDIAKFDITVISEGNASLRSNISFTAHRTFGIFAQVTSDDFGLPLGHIGPFSSSRSQPLVIVVDITNSMEEGSEQSTWQILNPADLKSNTDNNPAIGTWDFQITETSGSTVVNTVALGPGDIESIKLTVTPGNELEAGNHTVYLRITEVGDSDEPKYFDLPIEFEIEEDMPDDLQIIQISPDLPMQAGDKRQMEFKVVNGNNVDLELLLDIDGPDGWDVDIESIPFIGVEAFDDKTFTVLITAPSDGVRDGDVEQIVITAEPLSKTNPYGPDYVKTKKVQIKIDCVGGIECLTQELTSPRQSTLAAGGGLLILLIFAAFLRGKRSAQYVEEYVEDEEESVIGDETEVVEKSLEEIVEEDDWDDDIEMLD